MRVYSRKYQKVTGWWVYAHLTPDYQLIYPGCSGRKRCSDRWNKSAYKETSLQPYIDEYGWNKLIHIVIADGLTKQQAEKIEGALIKQATADGWCINKRNSGVGYRDNPKEYLEKYRECHKTETKEYNKKLLSSIEGKIYNRVHNYNRNHTPIETPMEAKNKYLEYGYIPSYIKNDDLK